MQSDLDGYCDTINTVEDTYNFLLDEISQDDSASLRVKTDNIKAKYEDCQNVLDTKKNKLDRALASARSFNQYRSQLRNFCAEIEAKEVSKVPIDELGIDKIDELLRICEVKCVYYF